ncbi:MAG: acetyltransferase [Actinomycetia bacterium]|nr:acetyltransferase [Actinomycetes bacterium]
MSELLDNAAWHALTTVHEHHAVVVGRARRYHPDVSVFAAVETIDEEAWADLAELAGPGEPITLFKGEIPEPPAGWGVDFRAVGNQMTTDDVAHGPDVGAVRLGADDVDDMLELIEETKPGPFRPRTVELGTYWGVRDQGRLVAMAGERIRVPGWTELSAVCTHPTARGRGLAAALSTRVARGILERGEQPVLHVADGNDGARRVYERLGFTLRRQVHFAILRAPG